jgi:hypothetical protein
MNPGDTVTITGFSNANMNRTAVPIAVLDANRFTYQAAASVSTAPTGTGTVAFVTGAQAGQPPRTIRRANLRHENVVVRYSAFDRNATKHDLFNGDATLTGSWEILFGVGYRGNTNANRGTSSPADFQYAFYGIGSEAELAFTTPVTINSSPAYGVNWFGYVDDNTQNGPDGAGATAGGDYRAQTADLDAFTPSRLLNRGAGVATIDRNARNQARTNTFDAGAMGRNADQVAVGRLQSASGFLPQLAADARVQWHSVLLAEDSLHLLTADAAGLSAAAGGSLRAGRRLQVDPEDRNSVVEPE